VKGPSRIVLIAGLLATLAVVLAGMAGLLNRIEWWTQDQRFLRARASAEPMGDRVRLVAIDDRALDTIGRWPWSREVLAIAFDLAAHGFRRADLQPGLGLVHVRVEDPEARLEARALVAVTEAGIDEILRLDVFAALSVAKDSSVCKPQSRDREDTVKQQLRVAKMQKKFIKLTVEKSQ
jgi:hypothetical protein